eukprot:GHVU01233470.1.p1 GENE.GHVU01233470.1~~GHVU01233470.1.p1  ORF type:complete len:146 (-),score=10.44 GHVU01233470.1:386-823(-)
MLMIQSVPLLCAAAPTAVGCCCSRYRYLRDHRHHCWGADDGLYVVVVATVWPGRVNLEQAKVLMYEAGRLPDRIYYHAGDASTKAFLQWASRRGFDFRHFNIDLIAIGEDILAKYTLRWRTGNTKIRVGQPSQSVSQSVSQGMGA